DRSREGSRGDPPPGFRAPRGSGHRRRSARIYGAVDGDAQAAHRRRRGADRRDLPRERAVRGADAVAVLAAFERPRRSRLDSRPYKRRFGRREDMDMTTTIRRALVSLTASMLAAALPAHAHHSFPAQYDAEKPITLTGTVTEVQ